MRIDEMSDATRFRIRDSLIIIWTITAKDIIDALKNRLVVSLIIMAGVMLLMPKLLPYIFEQPVMVLPVYDVGNSSLVTELRKDPALSVLQVDSEEEFKLALCSAIYPEIGLVIPPDFNQILEANGQVDLQGYACWSRRFQVSGLQPKLEQHISQSLGQPVIINIVGNFVYPPSEGVFLPSLAAVNSIVVILTIGIVLVPNLLFEEKQTKTMQALLVSPASISQVVIAKALAGFFYILVTALVVFSISWADVTHWGAVGVFVIMGGIFSISVGLVLGSFYEKLQDIAGWTTVLVVVFVGAVFVKMIGLELPPMVEGILPWVPSVALADIFRMALAEQVSMLQLVSNVGVIMLVSALLYALVVWQVRRSDR
jgi:ABC-2 type transport system permease protein